MSSRFQGKNSRLDTRLKVTAHFTVSALSILLEPVQKMAIYSGFFMPKTIETMTNILQKRYPNNGFLKLI
jgi:hypothetical protein